MSNASGPHERESRWIAGVVMSAGYGLGLGLLTRDWITGAAAAGLLTAAVTLFLWLFPTAIDAGLPLRSYYLRAVGVLSVPLLLLWISYAQSPWPALRTRYGTSETAPAGVQGRRELSVVRPVRQFTIRRYRLGSSSTALGDFGVYLAPAWPWSLAYRPLLIPASDISACRRAPSTTLWERLVLGELGLEVELADDDGRVLEWCRERGNGSAAAR
jgi:hypothetical protein